MPGVGRAPELVEASSAALFVAAAEFVAPDGARLVDMPATAFVAAAGALVSAAVAELLVWPAATPGARRGWPVDDLEGTVGVEPLRKWAPTTKATPRRTRQQASRNRGCSFMANVRFLWRAWIHCQPRRRS